MQAAVEEVGVAGSAPDFDDWVALRGPALLRLAYTLTGNTADAEDVVQEALSRALPRWERISAVGDVNAYVRRMVVNAHTSWWRRFRRRESPVAEPRDSVVDGPGEEFDERRRLWVACQALPEVQRTAIVLRYYEQLEYAEIAELTGVREGSVRARVSRGLAVLRESMDQSMGDTDE
ncbi:SigE family RNA polymerase sigma factor [Nocardioides halotolerans]|jgi:RNA polymerase sigma-70 factor (sigma-E family)|uniref:SigE family RNA polymerase sigma factor n=1 Tax=Nocardioides halotolerans TaxID=433660 RepID=UPI00048F9B20|nr:SigE family RNA polymerase sigma factor [Nocardioides halotolerans]